MEQYILKSALVAEIERRIKEHHSGYQVCLKDMLSFIDTLEVKDPYEQCIQYPSIKDGIKAHAEVYSFNIESKLFNQLTKEQQALWRKEIEQACISGGNAGVGLARDIRYKENSEMKEVDLEKEINYWQGCEAFPEGVGITPLPKAMEIVERTAKHFFELGMAASNKAQKE